MHCTEVMLYISAFVDGDFTGMPEGFRAQVERRVQACPHCVSELALERATKSFIQRTQHDTCCPRGTVELIQSSLHHAYYSRGASALPF